MGVENMGLLLYAICRFVKPNSVLEVGAGYTSLWLLQAMADNLAELHSCHRAAAAEGGYRVAGAEWMRTDVLESRERVPGPRVIRQMGRMVPQCRLDPGDEARRVAGSPFKSLGQVI